MKKRKISIHWKSILTILFCAITFVGFAQTITLTYKHVSLTDQQNIYVDSVDENFGYMSPLRKV